MSEKSIKTYQLLAQFDNRNGCFERMPNFLQMLRYQSLHLVPFLVYFYLYMNFKTKTRENAGIS